MRETDAFEQFAEASVNYIAASGRLYWSNVAAAAEFWRPYVLPPSAGGRAIVNVTTSFGGQHEVIKGKFPVRRSPC